MFDYLRLDTSTVKITEAGKYTYTITYKKKKYNGNIDIVVDKTSLPKGEIESFIRITQFVDWIKLNKLATEKLVNDSKRKIIYFFFNNWFIYFF